MTTPDPQAVQDILAAHNGDPQALAAQVVTLTQALARAQDRNEQARRVMEFVCTEIVDGYGDQPEDGEAPSTDSMRAWLRDTPLVEPLAARVAFLQTTGRTLLNAQQQALQERGVSSATLDELARKVADDAAAADLALVRRIAVSALVHSPMYSASQAAPDLILVRTDEDNERALNLILHLMQQNPAAGTHEHARLAQQALICHAYEEKRYPIPAVPPALEDCEAAVLAGQALSLRGTACPHCQLAQVRAGAPQVAQPATQIPLPPYIYGRETAPNEKVWTEAAIRAHGAACQSAVNAQVVAALQGSQKAIRETRKQGAPTAYWDDIEAANLAALAKVPGAA